MGDVVSPMIDMLYSIPFRRLVAGEIEPVEFFDNPVVTSNGDERIISWHNTVLREAGGRITATLSSGLDITEKTALERQLRQADKLSAVGQLASGLAHEIGTPLSVIGGRAEYILRKMDPQDPLRSNLERIINQIDRITKIVKQLLSFTKTKPLEVRSFHIKDMLENALTLLEHPLDEQGILNRLDCPEGFPKVMADPDQILQVCFNIMLNAIQSMPEGGMLSIRVSRTHPRKNREDKVEDRFIKIEISDTGVGIREDKISNVFDPFYSTKEAGIGTGLGLSVSYGIMKSHGGWIDVESQLNQGSTFSIYLPIDRRAREATASLGEGVHG